METEEEQDKRIGEAIHYPDCWDTMAYSTLASALWEMIDGDFANKKCSQCQKPQGKIQDYKSKGINK